MVIKNPELLFVDKGEQISNVESIDSQGQYSFGLRFASFYLDINTSAYVPIIKVHINKKEQGRAHVIKTKRIVVRNLDFKTALCDAINTVFKYDPFKRNDETIKIAALDWALREETSEQFITQLYNYIHELDAKDARNKGVMLCDQIYNSTKTISPRGIAFSTNSKTGSIVLKIPPSMAI
ncbi:hypothetical protein I3271_06985 [Photobacterium leiognathi]|uniref:hypothetical protein n=1 Tax=Photobacterium leiognathi TaxID=553611 RepID=UPI001EE0ED85|nr:hypothetical protein [Photobacterium leiognathi]MCG3884430.1 hypothetical protein [Photobacterium leiognathi]